MLTMDECGHKLSNFGVLSSVYCWGPDLGALYAVASNVSESVWSGAYARRILQTRHPRKSCGFKSELCLALGAMPYYIRHN